MIALFASAVILSCSSQWSIADCKVESDGSISSGCSDPGPILIELGKANYVRTVASQFWVPTANVKPDDLVYVAPGKNSGDKVDAAVCAKDFLVQTKVSDLGGVSPAPPPVVTPAPSNGSVTLSWTIPTLNTDGSPLPLASITGFNTYYGMNAASLDKKYFSAGNTVLSHTFMDLAAGTWYFAATTLTATDESDRTNIASAVVAAPTVPPVTPPPVVPPVTIVESPGTWTLKKGTSNMQTGLATYADCKALAASKATATATKYSCTVSNTITVSK